MAVRAFTWKKTRSTTTAAGRSSATRARSSCWSDPQPLGQRRLGVGLDHPGRRRRPASRPARRPGRPGRSRSATAPGRCPTRTCVRLYARPGRRRAGTLSGRGQGHPAGRHHRVEHPEVHHPVADALGRQQRLEAVPRCSCPARARGCRRPGRPRPPGRGPKKSHAGSGARRTAAGLGRPAHHVEGRGAHRQPARGTGRRARRPPSSRRRRRAMPCGHQGPADRRARLLGVGPPGEEGPRADRDPAGPGRGHGQPRPGHHRRAGHADPGPSRARRRGEACAARGARGRSRRLSAGRPTHAVATSRTTSTGRATP